MELGIWIVWLVRAPWIAAILLMVIASIPSSKLRLFHELVWSITGRGKILPPSSSQKWTVPQKYFAHFYVFGVAWTTLLLAITWMHAFKMAPLSSEEFMFSRYLTGGYHVESQFKVRRAVFLLLLMEIQVLRRLIESFYVFKYSPSARMNILPYLGGLYPVHLVAAGFGVSGSVCVGGGGSVCVGGGSKTQEVEVDADAAAGSIVRVLCRDRKFYRRQPQDAAFGRGVRRSCLRQRNEQELTPNVDAAAAAAAPLSLCVNLVAGFISKGKDHISSSEFDLLSFLSPLMNLGWCQLIGGAIFLWGWLHQRRCHAILGSLRKSPSQAKEYIIPHGDWFDIVSSPHYLAEIVINDTLPSRHLYAIISFSSLNGVMLCNVGNLSLSAGETHRWYLLKFEHYPANRNAIFPYVY
uniref:3-oxo-5-alpha-steroid 4-dehydrogenase C-terminal domain-containing protein n=1 Tax=Brassica oleracea TaxID=3712 RepID=A0A3P6B0W3_BRAOL|nr:unnamed protein product [Brassica oleracea]